MSSALKSADHLAIVVRPPIRPRDVDQYLMIDKAGARSWTRNSSEATAFSSMREAARTALHLPGEYRAFGLPASGELAIGLTLH